MTDNLTFVELFAGAGGLSLGLEMAGWRCLAHAEIEPHARAVLRRRWPNVPLLGDVVGVNGRQFIGANLVSGGSPCFPAGTFITTTDGYTEIENIRVGDRVLTHTGRWQRVVRIGGKTADTITLRGHGHPLMEVTLDHPFYAKEKGRIWNNTRRSTDAKMSAAHWMPAAEMIGRFWATPLRMDALALPKLPHDDAEALLWLAGRWVGDGWIQDRARTDRKSGRVRVVYLCCAHREAEALQRRLCGSVRPWARIEHRTATKFRVGDAALALFLTTHFGRYAHGKKIPAWLLTAPEAWRRAFLDGYRSADGCVLPTGMVSMTTVSRALAFGIRQLCETLGECTSVYHTTRPRKTVIEGRTVNQRDSWIMRFHSMRHRSSQTRDTDHAWGLVRRIRPGRKNVRVYNLEVEHDNSYVAENIVVHNCQDISVAGNRRGMRQDSGTRSSLFFEQVRIWDESEAPHFLWENVLGAFSSNGGRDFAAVLSSLVGSAIPVPADGWRSGGVAAGRTGVAAWRVCDAQFFGIPQRRRRVFVVGARAGGCDPSEILSLAEGMRRHSQARGKARGRTAGVAGGRAGAQGELAVVAPTLAAGAHPGSYNGMDGAQIAGKILEAEGHVVLSSGQANAEIGENVSTALTALHEAPIVFDIKGTEVQSDEGVSQAMRKENGGGHLGTIVSQEAFQKSQRSHGVDDGETWVDDGIANTLNAHDVGDVRTNEIVIPLDMRQLRRGETNTKSGRGGESVTSGTPSTGIGEDGDPSFTLGAEGGPPAVMAFKPSHFTRGKDGPPSDIAPPLAADADRGDQESVVFDARGNGDGKIAPTLAGDHQNRVTDYTAIITDAKPADIALTVKAGDSRDSTQTNYIVQPAPEVVGTLDARHAGGFQSPQNAAAGHLQSTLGVPRRLTPKECERLQSWPDDLTKVGLADADDVRALLTAAEHDTDPTPRELGEEPELGTDGIETEAQIAERVDEATKECRKLRALLKKCERGGGCTCTSSVIQRAIGWSGTAWRASVLPGSASGCAARSREVMLTSTTRMRHEAVLRGSARHDLPRQLHGRAR